MKNVKKFRAFLAGFILFVVLEQHPENLESGGTEAE